jgi:hypothetical protein
LCPEAWNAEPAQEILQVEAAPNNLAIITRKKKGEEEASYFIGGKGKNKGKNPKANCATPATKPP